MVASHKDTIYKLDKNFRIIDEINISFKKKNSCPQRHTNDCPGR